MAIVSLDNIGNLPDILTGKPTLNTVKGKSVAADDPSCTNTGVTDEGIIASSKWKNIIAATVAAYNTLNSLRMARLQRDLGEKYLKLAEDYRNYYNQRYKPLEIDLTQEALNLPLYSRDKEQLNTGQMMITARLQTAGAIDNAIACTGRYCTGQRAAIINDQLMQQATVESTVAGMAHRYTDREEINRNNLRWEKREQVLKLGRDIPSQAVSYASLAAGSFGSLGRQAGLGAEGAIQFLAYERKNTNYPERRPPISVSIHRYTTTKLEPFEPKPPTTYKKPEEPKQPAIKLSN